MQRTQRRYPVGDLCAGEEQADIYIAPLTADEDGYLLHVDPASISNVTNGVGSNEFHPSWSPDGQKLACFHDGGVDEWLNVIDMAIGQVHPIWPDYGTVVCGEDRATWTSDGLDLVYRTDFSGIPASDLTIIHLDGMGGPANYSNTSTFAERTPAWNPTWDPFGP